MGGKMEARGSAESRQTALILWVFFLGFMHVFPSAKGQDFDLSLNGYEGDFRPTDVDYIRSTALQADHIIGAVLVVLCLVGTVLFVIVRCGCMCAGKGFCLQSPEQQPSNTTTRVIQVAILIFSLGAIVGAVLSMVGTDKATVAVSDLVEVTVKEKGLGQLQDYLDRLDAMAGDAIAAAGDLSDGSGGLDDLRSMEDTISSLREEIDDISGEVVEQTDNYLGIVLQAAKISSYVIAGLVLVLVLMGLLAAIISKKKLLICPLVAIPLWLIFAWLLFTVFKLVHGIMVDTCGDISGTAQYCHGLEQDEDTCRQYFIGTALSDAIQELDPESQLIKVTSGINQLVEEANQELEAAYDQACQAVNQLNTASPVEVLAVPGFCAAVQQRELLCLPFTDSGRVDTECGTNPNSRYTRLANFEAGFEKLHCKEVPDMQAAMAVDIANFQAPSGPAIICASDDRFIGDTMFTDLGNKASAAGAVFDSFDVVIELVELEPMWNIIEHISGKDCPAAVDALFFMYLAFCVLGSFLMALSVSWLCGYKYLSWITDGKVAPAGAEDYYGGGEKTGLIVGTQPPVAAPMTYSTAPPPV